MKNRFINFTISFITKYDNYSEEDLQKMKYGIEGIYLTITKCIIIIILSLLLGIFKETVVTLILFNIIRFSGFGFHAEKSYQCLILSILFFIGIPLLFVNVNISQLATIIICAFCMISYLLFAPADTKKRPLPNKRKRLIRKISTVLIGTVYSLFIICLSKNFLTPLLLSTLVIQALIINPLFYTIFRQPYNNYKSYIRA